MEACYQSDENARLAGISGLIEILCKSTPASDSASEPAAISLSQIGPIVEANASESSSPRS